MEIEKYNGEFDLLREGLVNEYLRGDITPEDFHENMRLVECNRREKVRNLTTTEPFRLLKFLDEP